MESIPFAEYGIALSSIILLVIVIRIFIKHIEKKDDTFTDVINNHLSEAKEVNEKLVSSNNALSKSHERLEGAIERLVDRL